MIVLSATLRLPLLGSTPTVTAFAVPPPSEREVFSGTFSTSQYHKINFCGFIQTAKSPHPKMRTFCKYDIGIIGGF
jgi:hypothetical protein